MKKIRLFAVLGLMFAGTPFTQAQTPPTVTTNIESSADGIPTVTKGTFVPHALANVVSTSTDNATTRILMKRVFLPDKGSTSWPIATRKAAEDLVNDTVPILQVPVTAPTNYTVCNGHFDYFNVVSMPHTPFWLDTLNPAAPFQSESGQHAWVGIKMWSTNGENLVSLDKLKVMFHSNDGGQLDSTATFGGVSYSSLAFAITKEGTRITSGPSSQMGQQVVIFVQPNLFNGNDTQDGFNAVKVWVNSYTPYKLAVTASTDGTDASSTVFTTDTVTVPPLPALNVPSLVDGFTQLSVQNADTNSDYLIYGRQDLKQGGWYLDRIVHGTNMTTYPMIDGSRFFEARNP